MHTMTRPCQAVMNGKRVEGSNNTVFVEPVKGLLNIVCDQIPPTGVYQNVIKEGSCQPMPRKPLDENQNINIRVLCEESSSESTDSSSSDSETESVSVSSESDNRDDMKTVSDSESESDSSSTSSSSSSTSSSSSSSGQEETIKGKRKSKRNHWLEKSSMFKYLNKDNS